MPKGVIWGGAVDGSNHDGAMVTCQAITISPAAGWAVAPRARPRSRVPAISHAIREPHERTTTRATVIGSSRSEPRWSVESTGAAPARRPVRRRPPARDADALGAR